jgi:hypothetical protein
MTAMNAKKHGNEKIIIKRLFLYNNPQLKAQRLNKKITIDQIFFDLEKFLRR